jgi:hypothetical protein
MYYFLIDNPLAYKHFVFRFNACPKIHFFENHAKYYGSVLYNN